MPRPLFTLGPRLEAVAYLASGAHRLIDVGSDHARLPVWMLLNKRLSYAFAGDISPFSVEKIRSAARKFHLESCLEARLSDGLSAFMPDDADTVVLAGMGGETIAGILSACPWILHGEHRVVIQCMSSLDRLDERLAALGFIIEDECVVRDAGRLYSAVRLRGGGTPHTDCVLPSRHLLSSPLAGEYLDRLILLDSRRLNGVLTSSAPDSEDISACQKRLSHYQKLKKEFCL